MALYITNVAMMWARSNLSSITSRLNTTYQRLSSGSRVNSAKDDPAGFMIASRLTSEINGLKQGSRNANDGLSVAQTAEGALDEIGNMLQSIRTLAVQAATGTNSDDDRRAINAQVTQLCDEITRISCQTTYAGSKILCGAASAGNGSLFNANGGITLHVGAHHGNTITINALNSGFGMAALAGQLGFSSGTGGYLVDSDGIARFSVSSMANAEDTLASIDKFISRVDSARGELGAVQNRLESVIRINENTRTNVSDARSRIMDTDYAEEVSNLSAQSIMQQMAVAMMQRLSQQQNVILQLLQA